MHGVRSFIVLIVIGLGLGAYLYFVESKRDPSGVDKKDKVLKVNWDDEIIKGTLVAKDGQLVHPSLQQQGA